MEIQNYTLNRIGIIGKNHIDTQNSKMLLGLYLIRPNMYSNTLYTCTIWPFMYTNIYAGQDNGRNLVISTFEAIMG